MVSLSNFLAKIFPSKFIYKVESIEISGFGKYVLGEEWFRRRVLFSEILSYSNPKFSEVLQVSTSINSKNDFNVKKIVNLIRSENNAKIIGLNLTEYCSYFDTKHKSYVWITGHKAIQVVITLTTDITEQNQLTQEIQTVQKILSSLQKSLY